MPIEVRIGCRKTTVNEISMLRIGSILPLEKPAGETLDVFVGGVRLASAEVVVVNDRLGIRITDFYLTGPNVTEKKAQ